ncbi:MAG: DNA-protecting protein DprA, partial [Micrococcales bacterium]|nr:DNA-protecting protein DprA [Micrococcales bacterium]
MKLPFDLDNPTLALAAWSRICEPGDQDAHRLIQAGGPSAALHWLVDQVERPENVGPGVSQAVKRWLPRLDGLDPRRELKVMASLGGRLVTPDSPEWPPGLNDLGDGAPLCLWVWASARTDLAGWWSRSVAMVGARACTHYGQTVARSMAGELADAGYTVVSGGAFGIDAAAHS